MEGGVGAFTRELARALNDLNHEIHVITGREARPKDAPRTLSRVFEPIDLGYAQLHARIDRWRWPSVAPIVDATLRYELDVVNIQYQAAAYNMNSAMINLLPWRLRGVTATVVTFHDLRVPYLFPKSGPLRRAAVRFMARRAQGAIATNGDDYETLRSWRIEPERLRQIPIGSNITTYTPNHIEIAEVRDDLKLATADCLLGYFGFLNASKGADTLLRALARLDARYHLVFIGGQTGASDSTNETFLAQMRDLIADLGLSERVHWTGFLSDVRVSAHLHAADVIVMPYRDGVSLRRGTLMAALAHGRPIISTTPQKSTAELVHGENIWLAPPDDDAALAEAIATLAADPALRQRLAAGAADVGRLFTWDQIAAQTAAFYAQIHRQWQAQQKNPRY